MTTPYKGRHAGYVRCGHGRTGSPSVFERKKILGRDHEYVLSWSEYVDRMRAEAGFTLRNKGFVVVVGPTD